MHGKLAVCRRVNEMLVQLVLRKKNSQWALKDLRMTKVIIQKFYENDKMKVRHWLFNHASKGLLRE